MIVNESQIPKVLLPDINDFLNAKITKKESVKKVINEYYSKKIPSFSLSLRKYIFKNPEDKWVKCLYSLSHYISLDLISSEPNMKIGKEFNFFSGTHVINEAIYFRNKSIKDLNRSAESLFCLALPMLNDGNYNKLKDIVDEILDKDSHWALANYLAGQYTYRSASSIKKQSKEMYINALRLLHKSEKLDPELQKWNLYIDYAHCYFNIKDYKTTKLCLLKYLDIHGKRLTPQKLDQIIKWQNSLSKFY